MHRRRVAFVLIAAALLPAAAAGQTVSHRGFLEVRGVGYPQTTASDSTRLVGEALVRHEVTAKPAPWLRLEGHADLRGDTHGQTDWGGPALSDRSTKRPALSIRRLDAMLAKGPVSLDLGKQFVRWGKTDILNPTDRFAPRDYLAVVDSEILAVTGGRLTVGLQSNALDLVAARFTPSRMPLVENRWSGITGGPAGTAFADGGAAHPARAQLGARWNHVGSGFECSLSAFRGNTHLPVFAAGTPALPGGTAFPPAGPPPAGALVGPAPIRVARAFPEMWMLGADAAVPLSPATIKGEAAFFGSGDARAGEYWLYVIQLERQRGEWVFVGGYAGEAVTRPRAGGAFAPDRGLAKAFLGRASYTIDAARSAAFEGAVRQTGDGAWLRFEYSQASGRHLRLTIRATIIGGAAGDFLGRYARNSHVTVGVRYSY
ncbi:MAG TPA: hypothetical protein PLN93_03135 [Vicinamibacterales bacterium]|nr:hypothetical protein [Vicinamibacterales bacterium]HOQ60198.1 hypothetical protein [Vicinamibacterales bacterium]HPK70912.1 hypothetical protein [Vicinamibacterales bacterium]